MICINQINLLHTILESCYFFIQPFKSMNILFLPNSFKFIFQKLPKLNVTDRYRLGGSTFFIIIILQAELFYQKFFVLTLIINSCFNYNCNCKIEFVANQHRRSNHFNICRANYKSCVRNPSFCIYAKRKA